MIGTILLAAGGSTRMGQAKQALPFRGKTLLSHAVEVAQTARLGPVVVVLGSEAERLRGEIRGEDVHTVINHDWREGMGGSVAAGLAELDRVAASAAGILVMLADQPRVRADFLQKLALEHASGARIVASAYEDSIGVPALFDRIFFEELRQLRAAEGARGIIQKHRGEVRAIPIGAGAFDIDTAEDYARLIAADPTSDP